MFTRKKFRIDVYNFDRQLYEIKNKSIFYLDELEMSWYSEKCFHKEFLTSLENKINIIHGVHIHTPIVNVFCLFVCAVKENA